MKFFSRGESQELVNHYKSILGLESKMTHKNFSGMQIPSYLAEISNCFFELSHESVGRASSKQCTTRFRSVIQNLSETETF